MNLYSYIELSELVKASRKSRRLLCHLDTLHSCEQDEKLGCHTVLFQNPREAYQVAPHVALLLLARNTREDWVTRDPIIVEQHRQKDSLLAVVGSVPCFPNYGLLVALSIISSTCMFCFFIELSNQVQALGLVPKPHNLAPIYFQPTP